MFDLCGRVLHLDVGECVRAGVAAEQERVALGVVPGAFGRAHDLHEPAVGVLSVTGRDRLGDDGAAGVLADVDHLGAGVGLLVVGGEGDRVELADRVVALKDYAGVLPGYGRARLDLGPGDLRVVRRAPAALGDEVVDPAAAFGVAGVPVLHGGVLDLGALERDELDHRRVQLVLVPHRCGAALEVAHVRSLFGDDEGPFELAGLGSIDAEIGGELHRAAHALWDVAERPVGEHRGVERREKVVPKRDDRAEVPAYKIGMVLDGFGEGAEDDAGFGQFLLERLWPPTPSRRLRPRPRRRDAPVRSREIPSLSNIARSSGSTSSMLASAALGFGAA